MFAADSDRGEAIARRIEAGAVCVNDAAVNYFPRLEAPMGGVEESGIGVRHGADGIRKYCNQQALLITPRLALKRELHFFPYSRSGTKRLGKGLKLLYGRGKRD